MDRPGTDLFAPILCDLQVSDRAHIDPFANKTPHCFSTSTGPLGLAAFGCLASSFFFFLDGPLSSSSAFRFLPVFFAPVRPSPMFAVFLADVKLFLFPVSSTDGSGDIPPFLSLRSAASLASLASFFFRKQSWT